MHSTCDLVAECTRPLRRMSKTDLFAVSAAPSLQICKREAPHLLSFSSPCTPTLQPGRLSFFPPSLAGLDRAGTAPRRGMALASSRWSCPQHSPQPRVTRVEGFARLCRGPVPAPATSKAGLQILAVMKEGGSRVAECLDRSGRPWPAPNRTPRRPSALSLGP